MLKRNPQHWLNLMQLLPCSCLQVRDITTSPEWERAYGLVIPVLTCADADGSNEVRNLYICMLLSRHALVPGRH